MRVLRVLRGIYVWGVGGRSPRLWKMGGTGGEAPRMWILICDQIVCDQMLGDQIAATKLLRPIVVDPNCTVMSRARKIVTKFHNYSYEIVMSLVIVNSYENAHNSYQIVK